jgi:hypothetical protein
MNSKLSDLITLPRICAAFLGVGGSCWAMIVGVAMLLSLSEPKTGLLTMLYFLPGWIVYFGWMTIATGDHPKPLSDRFFWLLSSIVNIAYFVYEFQPWKWLSSPRQSLNLAGYWWLITGFLSLICFFAEKNKPLAKKNIPNEIDHQNIQP